MTDIEASGAGRSLMDPVYRMFQHLLVLGLAVMALMVFANVVLRYAFNSGFTLTEELARFIFVWLTFLGSIVALREGTHLGMDTIVSKLSRKGKVACFVISHLLMLGCCGMLWAGCWQQTMLNMQNYAPVTGMPIAIMYSVGLVAAALMSVTLLSNLWRVFRGQMRDDELVSVSESEERVETH